MFERIDLRWRKMSLSVACKNDTSVISLNLQRKFFTEKHSQGQELISLWSLANSSVIL